MRTTGNPFVDTGLAVVANLAHLASFDKLELRHLFEVHGDGKQLADINSKLKSFTMFFTTNSLLTQPSIKDRNKRIEQYSAVVNALLNSVGSETVSRACESCGSERTLDFQAVVNSALRDLGVKPQERFVGRDWFPLAGSFGSDAQSLPSASRAPALCAICLFAVQYAPLVSVLYSGRLVLFSSTDETFWYWLVSDFYEEVERRILAQNYETLGKKEGSAAMVQGLLSVFDRLKEGKLQGEIPTDTVVHLWQFSNAQSQDCKIQQIPNAALSFLSSISREGWRDEVLGLIKHEGKKTNGSFLQCILERKDYSPLYPYKKFEGASPGLFALYQTKVIGRNQRSLMTAFKIASSFSRNYKGDFKGFRREFGTKARRFAPIKREIVNLVKSGGIQPADYYDLFPLRADNPTRTEYWGWNFVKYYLWHREAEDTPLESSGSETITETTELVYHASAVYNVMVERLGLDGFEKRVMARLEGRDISQKWLQSRFQELAQRLDGFTYGDWSRLFMSREGKTDFFEPLFRMRLLWAHYLSSGLSSIALTPRPNKEGSENMERANGLPQWLQSSLREYFEWYVDNSGIQRFNRVLAGIRGSDLGLGWMRGRLVKHSRGFAVEEWEKFLADEETTGYPQARFKIGLFLANTYRIRSQS